eukprot:3903379-Prymnesium_polylepis.2
MCADAPLLTRVPSAAAQKQRMHMSISETNRDEQKSGTSVGVSRRILRMKSRTNVCVALVFVRVSATVCVGVSASVSALPSSSRFLYQV